MTSTPAYSSPPPARLVRGEEDFKALPGPVLFLLLGVAVLGLAATNAALTVASLLALPVFIWLLRRPGEPPILLFAVGFQWLQVTAKVFHANVLGLPVAMLSNSPSVEAATWLGLACLIALAGGMRLGLRWLDRNHGGRAAQEALSISVPKAFLLYLALTFLASALRGYVWNVGGLAQVVFALLSMRWIGFFLLGYVVLRQRKGYAFLLAAIAFEFIGGIGFFSGFKTVIFYSLIVLGTVYPRLNARMVGYGGVALVALLIFGSAWSVIKPEFRSFLNEGTGQQRVRVSEEEKMGKLLELTGALTWQDISRGMNPLFRRVAYVDYLGFTMDYVPEVIPHEQGAVWRAAIQHTITPRVLFPSKPRLVSDSEHTMMYTGLHMASGAQGTSISIGYVGDAYIDFGKAGAVVLVFFLGIAWGLLYTYFLRRSRVKLLGFALACVVLLPAYQFEMVATKLVGGITLSFLVFALLMKFAERPLWAWLSSARPASAPRRVPYPALGGGGRPAASGA